MRTGDAVERMHFKRSCTYEEPWTAKFFLLMVVTQNVAHILAKEAFNALAKFLYAINIPLVHLPLDASTRLKRWNLLIYSEIPGDVSNKILDHGKSLHRKESDGLVERKSIQ